jgi:type IV pilus assembly protein PilV
VRRNTTVGLYLVTTTTSACALSTAGPSWIVSIDSPVGKCDVAPSDTAAPFIIQLRGGTESGGATTTVAAGQAAVVFNGLGRPTPLPAGTIAINFTDAAGAACKESGGPVRCLRAEISVGGQIRMCDPAFPIDATPPDAGLHMIQRSKVQGQAGVMLLEALIAILIFSLGILSLVALQATSIQLTGDAKYRTDATLLANRLIGEMWVSGGTLATLKTNFEADGAAYDAWLADVSGPDGLPGVVAASSGVESTLPIVSVDAATGVVRIDLFWRTPEMAADEAGHRHVVVSQIARNNP